MRSGRCTAPSAASSRCTTSRASPASGSLRPRRQSIAQTSGSRTSTNGTPTSRNSTKLTDLPMRSRKPANWPLGAVPILVPMPPRFAAVGDRQHDRHAVVAQTRAAPRLELGDEGEADRHHHGGGRGVGDPQRDEGGRHEDAGEEPPRVGADPLHDAEREPAVEVPLLHRRRDRHAAGEEEDVRVEIGRDRGGEAGGAVVAEDPEQRKEDDRQAGGPVDRYRLGQPPDRHQRRDRRRHRRPRTHLRLMVERRVDEGEEGGRDEADGDRQRLEARWRGVLESHGARSLSRGRPPGSPHIEASWTIRQPAGRRWKTSSVRPEAAGLSG